MFKDIKRQITTFNVLILIAYLVIFMLVAVLIMHALFSSTSKKYLKDVAQMIKSGEAAYQNHNDKDYHSQSGYNYIVWNSDHMASRSNVMNNLLFTKGRELEADSSFKDGDFRTFSIYDVAYRVYTTSFKENGKTHKLQVFQQITAERYRTSTLLTVLIFVGSGGILLLIPLSYFLAGKSLEPVKESYENQKKFVADASHELRTPLTVIQTNVEVLRLKEDEPLIDNIHWLDNISSESETMSKLVTNLLEIARADNNKMTINKEVFDLSALCAEVVDLMVEVAKEQQITLIGNIEENIDYKGDPDRIKQAIRILVDNAIKYTPGVGTVTVALSQNVRNVVIDVTDTGVGLSKEQQKKIFSRFFRVDDARNRESGGFGLGLNIADIIVRAHGGHIKVVSELDKGSTFSIVLPKTTL